MGSAQRHPLRSLRSQHRVHALPCEIATWNWRSRRAWPASATHDERHAAPAPGKLGRRRRRRSPERRRCRSKPCSRAQRSHWSCPICMDVMKHRVELDCAHAFAARASSPTSRAAPSARSAASGGHAAAVADRARARRSQSPATGPRRRLRRAPRRPPAATTPSEQCGRRPSRGASIEPASSTAPAPCRAPRPSPRRRCVSRGGPSSHSPSPSAGNVVPLLEVRAHTDGCAKLALGRAAAAAAAASNAAAHARAGAGAQPLYVPLPVLRADHLRAPTCSSTCGRRTPTATAAPPSARSARRCRGATPRTSRPT